MNRTFFFLASPYSKYPYGLEAAFELACETRGLLISAGVKVFSPIIHSHPVARICNLDPYDHSIWLPSEEPIMRFASGLIMLLAESWEDSVGMAHEQLQFIERDKPIVWMKPGVVPDVFLKTPTGVGQW